MSEQPTKDLACASPRQRSKDLIARQPIVNGLQQIMGYELFNRSRSSYGHTMASDATLILAALTYVGEENLVGSQRMFVNCTHEGLTGAHLELIPAGKLVLEIPPLGHAAIHEVEARRPTLQALQEQGFELAFNHTVLESVYAAWLPLADYIKLDLSTLARDQLTVLVQFARRHSRAELIAEKVESAQQHALARRLGFTLFQGFWFARPTVMQSRLLTPSQQSIIQLLALVREQASVEAIEEVLKKDAALAFNLLRLLNSASFGAHREITSFRQAVMLLGMHKLFRWAAMLLAATRDGGPPPMLGQTALTRARLMELLARHSLTDADADQAFICGMFSMLDHMLGLPLAAALALIPVPHAVSAALLRHEGMLGELLILTQACENQSHEQLERSTGFLALQPRDVNHAHLQALSWTACLSI